MLTRLLLQNINDKKGKKGRRVVDKDPHSASPSAIPGQDPDIIMARSRGVGVAEPPVTAPVNSDISPRQMSPILTPGQSRYYYTDAELEQMRGLGQGAPSGQMLGQGSLSAPPLVPQVGPRQQALAALNNKDYSAPRYRTPQGLETKRRSIDGVSNEMIAPGGKDRDTDHNWWDSVKSGLIGAGVGFMKGGLGGALGGGVTGLIGGAVDRNFDERMIDDHFRRPRLQQQANAEREQEMYNLNAQKQAAAINTIYADDARQREQLEVNQQKAENQGSYWEGQLREQEMRRVQQARLKGEEIEIRRKTANARIRQMEERLKDYDLDRDQRDRFEAGRNARADKIETGRNARAANVEAGRNTRAANAEAGRNTRAAMAPNTSGKGYLDRLKIASQLAVDFETGKISEEMFLALMNALER